MSVVDLTAPMQNLVRRLQFGQALSAVWYSCLSVACALPDHYRLTQSGVAAREFRCPLGLVLGWAFGGSFGGCSQAPRLQLPAYNVSPLWYDIAGSGIDLPLIKS